MTVACKYFMREATILVLHGQEILYFVGLLSFSNPVCYQLLWEEKSSRGFQVFHS